MKKYKFNILCRSRLYENRWIYWSIVPYSNLLSIEYKIYNILRFEQYTLETLKIIVKKYEYD